VTVSDGDDLQQTTKRDIYADFRVGRNQHGQGRRVPGAALPGGEVMLAVGQAMAMSMPWPCSAR
jgi:type III restriction enzyme